MVAIDFYSHCHRLFGMLLAECFTAGFNGEPLGRDARFENTGKRGASAAALSAYFALGGEQHQ
jgi:hypothetical protein